MLGEMTPERFAELRRAEIARKTGIPSRAAALLAAGELAVDEALVDAVDSGRSLYLYGPKGRGKTAAAAAVAFGYYDRHLHQMAIGDSCTFSSDRIPGPTGAPKRYVRARFGSEGAYLAGLRASFDGKGASEADVFDRYARCSLLVLDDLGKESYAGSDWALKRIWRLVDARYAQGAPTVVTSQYGPGEIADRLAGYKVERMADAGAVVDRLLEDAKLVEFSGANRRMDGPP